MAERDASSPFDAEWRAVEALVDAGEPFEYVEAAIDKSSLDHEHRAALWLGGWIRFERVRSEWPDALAPSRAPLRLIQSLAPLEGRETR